jgi:hypothetical protein
MNHAAIPFAITDSFNQADSFAQIVMIEVGTINIH